MSILKRIIDTKRMRLEQSVLDVPETDLMARIAELPLTRDFEGALRRPSGKPIRLIAECKRASPSQGLIREDFDPSEISLIYEHEGASAISVLTEEDHFQGDISYLGEVKTSVALPVLRKDFIVDPYQVYEARAYGADAILLIAAALEHGQASDLLALATELDLDVLFETHDFEDLEMALEIKARIIGINNRDLLTMEIDLHNTYQMMREIPSALVTVSESGIRSRQDVLGLEASGLDAILVGTSFMRAPDIGLKVRELMGR